MSKLSEETENSKKGLSSIDILKILGALGFIIPLILGYIQYRQSVQQSYASNFREIVSKLTSDKTGERIASATNLGTFIKKGEPYYEEAVDILINAVSYELDFNVLNAIRGSLEKTAPEDYKTVIQKLLNIDRNLFYYENANIPDSLKEKVQLTSHQDLASRFTSLFLEITKTNLVEDLKFNQNAFRSTVWSDIILTKVYLKNSAFSNCTITETDFNESKIINTIFLDSDLGKCNFSNSEISSSFFCNISNLRDVKFAGTKFKDVYFADSDLSGADFRGAIDLKPIYFYKARNIKKAIFDKEFKNELNKLSSVNNSKFIDYIEQSTLTSQRTNELMQLTGLSAGTVGTESIQGLSYIE